MSDFQLTDLFKLETELGSLLELAFNGLGTQICTWLWPDLSQIYTSVYDAK